MKGRADNTYDSIPYPSLPLIQTHPDRLATLATLRGMRPASVEACRVLELGCAGGGNLIPMAYALPESEFVGIDLAARQIADGQRMVAALGLKNIRLEPMNLLEVTADLGQFDYIIAHGLYSWLPAAAVQQKLLAICKENLAPHGVAYVSYNVYPGWHLNRAVREMLLYRIQSVSRPQERLAQARDLLDFLTEAILSEATPQAKLIRAYVRYLRDTFATAPEAYFLHDLLAEENEPLYFYQFVARAEAQGLQYLAETQIQTTQSGQLPAETLARLGQVAHDSIEVEQYLDFLYGRSIRQTLLCHQDIPLTRTVSLEQVVDLYVASACAPTLPKPDNQAPVVEIFRAANGLEFKTDHPATQAAMRRLAEIWPQAAPLKTLLTTGQAAGPDAMTDMQILAANLLKAYSASEALVEFHAHAPPFVKAVSERPMASPIARWQAQHNQPTLTNLRHEALNLAGLERYLLPFLDGHRDQASLLEIVERLIAENVLELQPGIKPLAILASALQNIADVALLVG
jgi:methyltransferase-like protein/2-polyprenyl-3-methyl-5-hydroxy-6-metoxy-1,4-benzoquinol methylase